MKGFYEKLNIEIIKNHPLKKIMELMEKIKNIDFDKYVDFHGPLHELCIYEKVNLDIIKFVENKFPGSFRNRDEDGETPIYGLFRNKNLTFDIIEFIQSKYDIFDDYERNFYPLENLLENGPITLEIIKFIYPLYKYLQTTHDAFYPDIFIDICNNNITVEMLEYLFSVRPDYFDEGIALYRLCNSNYFNLELFKYAFSKNPRAFSEKDNGGESAFHSLLQNNCLNLEILKFLYSEFPKLFEEKWLYGFNSLHCICLSSGLSVKMIEFMYEKIPKLFIEKDSYGKTALQLICLNKYLKREILDIMYDKYSTLCNTYGCFNTDPSLSCSNEKVSHSFDIIKFVIFTFSLKKNEPNIFNIQEDKDYQAYCKDELKVNQYNFKYLSTKIKKNIKLLVLSLKRLHIKVPKFLIFEIALRELHLI